MSLLKKLGHAIKSVAKVALPVAASFIPGVGPVAGKLLSAGLGAALTSGGAKKAANTEADAHNAAIAEQQAAQQRAEAYQQPYRDLGTSGINSLTKLNGGDYSGFNSSPDYLYARDEALKGVQGSAAARGGLFSGNTGLALEKTAGGLASQNLGNYRNSLFQTIGVGQGATNNLTNATLGVANNVGNALIGSGDARASGIIGSTNAITGGIDQAASAVGDYVGNNLFKKKPVAGANALYGYNLRQRPTSNLAVG